MCTDHRRWGLPQLGLEGMTQSLKARYNPIFLAVNVEECRQTLVRNVDLEKKTSVQTRMCRLVKALPFPEEFVAHGNLTRGLTMCTL